MALRPSIRVLVTLVVLCPIVVASAILLAISATTTRRISEDMGDQLTEAATASVERQVARYLAEAVGASDMYARRLEQSKLLATDLASWRPLLFDDLVSNEDVASICFANPSGDAVWLLRAHGRLEYGEAHGEGETGAVEHEVDPRTGALAPQPIRSYQYIARERPWYRTAVASDKPTWTPIYFWFAEGGAAAETGAGYTRTIRGADGSLLGVLVVDVTLNGLSSFLRSLPLAQRGQLYIVDEEGLLVASSTGEVNSSEGARLKLGETDHAAARAAAGALTGSDNRAPRTVIVDGAPSRLNVASLQPYPGIDWRVIVLAPEAEFLSRARTMRTRSLILAGLVAGASVLVGLWFSRRLTQPLMNLVQHVRRVTNGDFSSRVDLRSARELEDLSGELNEMTAGLKERLELARALGLAMEVQQCLLPQSAPRVAGFEITSRCQYCDTTGGDYFDFIDVAQLPEQGVFIALGDVTGHGIASALIMASARAALRAYAVEEQSPAILMTKVNRAFSADTQHGRFMTLALLIIESPAGPVRWASAGHDPTIVYDSAADEFVDLEGGDMPLGIIDDHDYEEYRREELSPGSILLLGTDGIWEMTNSDDEPYGKDRLKKVIRDSHRLSTSQIADAIEADLETFRGPAVVFDDVTFVVIKVCKASDGG